MFFEKYCEFIEALYCVHYCNITENKKINYYKNIYNDYLKKLVTVKHKKLIFKKIYILAL